MSEDFTGKVKTLLEDPEMLSRIAAIASGLGGGQPASTPPAPETNPQEIVTEAPREAPAAPTMPSFAPDTRVSLLNALKPFLRPERQAKLDSITRALSVAGLVGKMKG